MLCGQHLPTFLAPFLAENPPLALIHSLLVMVLGALHLVGGMDHVSLLGGAIRRGVDGADAGVVGFFLCVCFELDALALAVEWSFWATCPATIASKPLKLNLGPTLVAERSVVRVGGEVKGCT